MANIIECNDFSFFYGERRILDNIHFALERGDWLSIIGTNGSGKSTLLKSMLRLVKGRAAGEICVAGRSVGEYSQKDLARILAYVPQAGGKVPPFTILEFLNLSRYPFELHSYARKPRVCASVERALELTNISHLAERRMDQLSGGQVQRAFLAAALAQDAGVLLLDEPTSFLDPRHAHEMNELLKNLHSRDNYTIIMVTHDLSLPLDAGGKALVLRNSGQLYFGPVDDLVGQGVLEDAFEYEFSYLAHPKTGKPLVVA